MKQYSIKSGSEGFSYREFSSDILFNSVNCSGTDLNTASDFLPADTPTLFSVPNSVVNIVIVAKYVDTMNYSIRMLPVPLTTFHTVDIYASAVSPPVNASIVVFLPSGHMLANGDTNISIPIGSARRFKMITSNIWCCL